MDGWVDQPDELRRLQSDQIYWDYPVFVNKHASKENKAAPATEKDKKVNLYNRSCGETSLILLIIIERLT